MDVLLTKAQAREIYRLRFRGELEHEFREFASRERIVRIRVAMTVMVVLGLLAPVPADIFATETLRRLLIATNFVTAATLVVVFVPRFSRVAVYLLPLWDFAQQVAFGSSVRNEQPYMQSSIQLAMAILVVAAVRMPTWLTLAFLLPSVVLRYSLWRAHGVPSGEYTGALMFLILGFCFLAVGSYLTEVADRRAFLVGQLLQGERKKSEDLLDNILPAGVSDKLKNGGGTFASYHDEATILFADVVGFTPFAAKHTPEEVVGFLNELFSRFDVLVSAAGLLKVKTVGDAYMVAGGVPTYRADHVTAVADLALEMRGVASALGAPVRIGLHTGPVVAGVIGTKTLLYDMWGPTVNFASRLETAATEGVIFTSGAVAQALGGTHTFEPMGSRELKGVGAVEVFVLSRRNLSPMQADRPSQS